MKYDFLVKEKLKNSSDETDEKDEIIKKKEDKSIMGSTLLSTYEDFNIFLKKTQDNKENNIDVNQNLENENSNKKDKETTNNINNIKKDNSTLFESEKKTVENIVKYSSSFINIILKFIYIIKNNLMYLISKKESNTDSIKDKEIIRRFNKHHNKKNKHIEKKNKHIENDDKHIIKNDKHIEKNDKHILKNKNIEKNSKQIKKMNSYLLELD